MQRASKSTTTPCVVAAFEIQYSTVKLIKIDDFNWLVLFRDPKNLLGLKKVDCISFEHGWSVFSSCADRLKEGSWIN